VGWPFAFAMHAARACSPKRLALMTKVAPTYPSLVGPTARGVVLLKAKGDKKQNWGCRNKPAGARGKVKRVRCESSAAMVPKDKAVKRFVVS
jgi:hypothetical protein